MYFWIFFCSGELNLLAWPKEEWNRIRWHVGYIIVVSILFTHQCFRLPQLARTRRHHLLPHLQERTTSSTKNRRWTSIQVSTKKNFNITQKNTNFSLFSREFLEADVKLPQDKVKEITEVAVSHVNAAVVELRRLFLVEDLVDSIKFGVLLWCLTYLGAWFNGMTLLIIGKYTHKKKPSISLLIDLFFCSFRCFVHLT